MKYGFLGTGVRILGLTLIILILFAGGLFWFDFLGLMDGKQIIDPVLRFVGIKKTREVDDVEDPMLLDKERLNKQLEAISLKTEELDKWEEDLLQRESELGQMIEELTEKQESLEKREKSFNEKQNEIDNRRRNIMQMATYLVGMPPEKAKDILLNMENDMDVIDILRMTEELAQKAGEDSIVSYWLSLMPPERSAELARKMAKKIIE